MEINDKQILIWRKEGNPLGKLFILREEALSMREKQIKPVQEMCKIMEKQNKEIQKEMNDFKELFGDILRNYEVSDNIKNNTIQKEVLGNLWIFISNLSMRKMILDKKKYGKMNIKLRKHLEELNKIRGQKGTLNIPTR